MSTCLFVNRNGIPCSNHNILNTEYCHLKSHHPDLVKYQECLEKLYQIYYDKTVDHNNFIIKDVVGDGACLYRCFIVHLLKNLPHLMNINPEVYIDFMKVLNGFFQLSLEDSGIDIEKWTSFEYQTKINQIVDKKMLETNYLLVNKLARYIQIKLKDWLVKNKTFSIEDLGGFTIENLVENCHEMSLEQYDFLYNIFAGDLDYLLIKMDSDDENEDEKDKENTENIKSTEIPSMSPGPNPRSHTKKTDPIQADKNSTTISVKSLTSTSSSILDEIGIEEELPLKPTPKKNILKGKGGKSKKNLTKKLNDKPDNKKDNKIDENCGQMSKHDQDKVKENYYKKINIPDRWGSTSEIYAFSGLFSAVINVYVIKRFDKKTCSVVMGKKAVKTSRLELYQRVQLRIDENRFPQELNILLIEKNGFPHYQYLESKCVSPPPSEPTTPTSDKYTIVSTS